MDGFDSENEAVYQAAQATRAVYQNKAEAISIVYQDGDRYYFTPPDTQFREKAAASTAQRIPASAKVVHLVHNHPKGKGGDDEFSEDDIGNANRLKVPSTIIYGEQGIMRTFMPGKSRVRTLVGPRKASYGEEFIRFPKLHAGESVVNRILNTADEIEQQEAPQ